VVATGVEGGGDAGDGELGTMGVRSALPVGWAKNWATRRYGLAQNLSRV
jgi:hypothetical protein